MKKVNIFSDLKLELNAIHELRLPSHRLVLSHRHTKIGYRALLYLDLDQLRVAQHCKLKVRRKKKEENLLEEKEMFSFDMTRYRIYQSGQIYVKSVQNA
jgi:hypothetical protein